MELYAFLMLTADFILLITLPLQLRLLTVLLSKDRRFVGLDSHFYRCLTHIILVDFLSAIISIVAIEPATHGIFREFFENNSGWISKIVIFQAVILGILSLYFHLLIALNRLTAVIFTMHHSRIWEQRVLKLLHAGGWSISLLLFIPLIWPIRGSYTVLRSPFGGRGLAFVLTTKQANMICQLTSGTIGVIIEIAIIIVYLIILSSARKFKDVSGLVMRSTAASVFMCSSGWFLLIFSGSASIYGHVFRGDFFSLEVYFGLFKLGYAVNDSITAWVTVCRFGDIRSRVLSCCTRRNQIVPALSDIPTPTAEHSPPSLFLSSRH